MVVRQQLNRLSNSYFLQIATSSIGEGECEREMLRFRRNEEVEEEERERLREWCRLGACM